jgi:hypothetical protein
MFPPKRGGVYHPFFDEESGKRLTRSTGEGIHQHRMRRFTVRPAVAVIILSATGSRGIAIEWGPGSYYIRAWT